MNPASTHELEPIVHFPDRFNLQDLVWGGEKEQLWKAEADGRLVALRLFRFRGPPPLLDPSFTMRRQGEILVGLGLKHLAEPLRCGADEHGLFGSEAWVEGKDLGQLAPLSWDQVIEWVRPIAHDLEILHRHGKVHAGLRPSRVRVGDDGPKLVAQPWSVARAVNSSLSGFSDDQSDASRSAFLAPEYNGMARQVHYNIDIFAFCKTILVVSDQTMPAAVRSELERGLDPNILARPTMARIHDSLRC